MCYKKRSILFDGDTVLDQDLVGRPDNAASVDAKGPYVQFSDWTGGRAIPTVGSNAGAAVLPFQNWRPFKEAFAPELVERALKETAGTVQHIADPFGGSGTTALAAQFLGAKPTTIEVNPFLTDLIKAKIAPINFDLAAETRRTNHRPPERLDRNRLDVRFDARGDDRRCGLREAIARTWRVGACRLIGVATLLRPSAVAPSVTHRQPAVVVAVQPLPPQSESHKVLEIFGVSEFNFP